MVAAGGSGRARHGSAAFAGSHESPISTAAAGRRAAPDGGRRGPGCQESSGPSESSGSNPRGSSGSALRVPAPALRAAALALAPRAGARVVCEPPPPPASPSKAALRRCRIGPPAARTGRPGQPARRAERPVRRWAGRVPPPGWSAAGPSRSVPGLFCSWTRPPAPSFAAFLPGDAVGPAQQGGASCGVGLRLGTAGTLPRIHSAVTWRAHSGVGLQSKKEKRAKPVEGQDEEGGEEKEGRELASPPRPP